MVVTTVLRREKRPEESPHPCHALPTMHVAFLEETFAVNCQSENSYGMALRLLKEMLVVEALLPLAQTKLRAPWDAVTTCSHSSGRQGATRVAAR